MKSSSWSFSAVVFRALGGLTINKLFAFFLGAPGITLLSHFQNLTALFTLLPNEGVNRSIMKYWSDPQMSEHDKLRHFKTSFWITSTIFGVTLGVLYFWHHDYFFDRFITAYTPREFLIIFIPSVFLMLMSGYLNSVILALREVKAYAVINILSLLLLVGIVYVGVNYGTIDQALLSFAIGYAAMFFLALIYLIRRRKSIKLGMGKPDKASVKRIGKFIAMAISAIVFGKLLDFGVRDYAIELYDLERTGLWQAVAKMSTSYLLVFSGTVGVIYYPKIASLIHERGALRQYVLKVMGFMTFVSIMALGIYYLNKEFILNLFFADGFDKAAYLVRYQVIGDFFALLAYLLAYVLSARVQTMKYIAAQFVSALIYLGLLSVLIDQYNLEAFTLAYMFRYIGFFLILLVFNRKLLRR
ncbi:MATE family efflux transporter [Roseivirga misakiensis]|uniref:polysaccharide biosynthesis C-terminal domain-containing protein n=1 Tax=Roseivirga misakiensis TaxID=1563681 RepID=UPI000A795508|nr:polysaccharide biosynthesis C-terminal domain-containing protein [Roseivirga misakiensis]